MAEPSQPGQGVAPDISGDLQVAPLFQDDGLVREWSMLPPELLEVSSHTTG